jgi:two-component system, response regulator PdtaR
MKEDRRVILVVEDEILIRMVAVEGFRDMGFHVLEAGCASEALEMIGERQDLWCLFTDIEMPGPMDGLELAHRLRNRFPSARIVVSSGRKLPFRQELPARVRFIAKPYRMNDLQVAVADEDI